jgi:hypothetical protein
MPDVVTFDASPSSPRKKARLLQLKRQQNLKEKKQRIEQERIANIRKMKID